MQSYNAFNNGYNPNLSISNAGAWSFQENLSYAIFIDIHKKSMTSKKKMRQIQFYEKLSLFVSTRTAAQCRSHHQKVFAKLKYISKITEIFKTQLGIINYKQFLKQGLENIKRIEQYLAKKNTQPQPHSLQLPQLQQPLIQPQPYSIQTDQRPQQTFSTPSTGRRGIMERFYGQIQEKQQCHIF